MSVWKKMKMQKKIKSWQTPYRLFYLSSIATILTVGGTTFFRFINQKEKFQQKTQPKIYNWFSSIKNIKNFGKFKQPTKLNFWQRIQKLFGKN